jgi:hypothetical protein
MMTTAKQSVAPIITRIVVHGKASMARKRALECLEDVSTQMRKARGHADIVITPGGFIEEKIKQSIVGLGWETPASALSVVSREVEQSLISFMTALRQINLPASYMTLGIDCMLPNDANAELVATIDLSSMKIIAWTGKSYPTLFQEKVLMHVTDLGSHLQKIGKWKCIVLGCHDLNMFSPRSIATRDPQGYRGRRSDEFIRQAIAYRPDVVLQHPHMTDTPNIWKLGWSGVMDRLEPGTYASGISYFKFDDEKPRATLDKVLSQTCFGNVNDYVWHSSKKSICSAPSHDDIP